MDKTSQGDLRVCLTTPKFGTLLFFLVMIILIPIGLASTGHLDILQYYFPFTVLLASTLTSAGAPNNFTELYPLFPTTIMGFLSANLINFFALAGILWYVIGVGIESNNKEVSAIIGLIIITLTFSVATQAIPFFIRQGDMFIRRVAPTLKFPGNWHKYFIGVMMIIFILVLEILIIGLLTNMKTGSSSNSNNFVSNLNNNLNNNIKN
jgi:hypothetical protein